jgi:hypothetical protein
MGVPLLIISLAIYNIFVFLMPGFVWTDEIAHFRMKSEGEWGLTAGDLMVAGSILILAVEMVRAGRGGRSIVDHILSTLLFVGMMAEFVLVKEAASTTFFLLVLISFVDVTGGFATGIRKVHRGAPSGVAEAPMRAERSHPVPSPAHNVPRFP